MLLASASGLDPHISPKAALLQVDRVVKARNMNETQKQELIQLVINVSESPQFGLFGEERVNVLLLNLKLDKIH
jgi:K+-transporting ATPase ATPase C chain